jgi:hypothetical protein
VITPADRLDRYAAQWRLRVRLMSVTLAGGLAFAIGAVSSRLAAPSFGLVTGTAVLLGALWWMRDRLRGVGVHATAVARHLNRVEPRFEDSAELLLRPGAALSALEQFQQARAARVLDALDGPLLPTQRLRPLLGAAALAAAVGVIVLALPARPAAAARPAPSQALGTVVPTRLVAIDVTITPPSYTGHAARTAADLDVDAEEGASVTWRATMSEPDAKLRLITSEHDTIAFAGNGVARTATLMATRSVLYDVELDGTTGQDTLHRLAVIKDRPPAVTIVEPKERTTIQPGDPLEVPVEVLGRDDYGLTTAEVVATITTGSGENVKFKEQRLPFTSSAPRDSLGRLWRRTLDLQQLGLAPGDELYFHVLVRDNRRPAPNEGRSETAFIIRVDTARAMVSQMTGLALKLEPEYFRSERQIIIDTEKLLAEQAKMPLQQFRDRSADIGIDQHLLRVRYGEMVGDENEGGGAEHDHDASLTGPVLGPQVMALPDEVVHKHDVADNATRMATGIKATLKDALAQMWDAERYLRTYEPRKALPFEYKALEMLKEIQQAARVYVKRVGFEPPPIDVAKKRLAGKQEEIVGRGDTRTREADRPMASVQDAVALLSSGADLTTASSRATVQAAGESVGQQALEQPGRFLTLLGTLRDLIRDPRACGDCRAAAVTGLLAMLPEARLTTQPRRPVSPAGKAYLDRLHGDR